MPTTLYDDDQNPIEGVLTPEEAKELQEKAQRAEELEKSIQEKEEELEKLRSKDTNFTKFREKTEEEKAKIMEKASAKEKMILQELNDLQGEREKEKKDKLEETRQSLLEGLAGDDEELKKSIELRAKEWGECKTPEEMRQRYNDAAILIRSDKPRVTPFNTFYPTSGYTPYRGEKRFTETQQGKESVTKWFPDVAAKIYKEKK